MVHFQYSVSKSGAAHYLIVYYYIALKRGAKYCDEYTSVLSAHISQKPHSRASSDFVYGLVLL